MAWMADGGSCGSFGALDEMARVGASALMVEQKWDGRKHVAECSLGGRVGTSKLKADFVWGGKVMLASSARDH